MSAHADDQSKSRPKRIIDLLPGGLLVAAVCAVGIYFTQNPAAFQKVCQALGFGPAVQQAQVEDDQPAAEPAPLDSVQEMQIPASLAMREEAEKVLALDNAESARDQFLPENRSRERDPKVLQTADRDANANLQLDRRFEADQPETATEQGAAAVRTAELTEPKEVVPPAAIAPESANVADSTGRKLPAIYKGARRTTAGGVHLTGGDDAANPTIVRRPGRTNVKASPAAVTGGNRSLALKEVQALIENGQDAEAYQQLSEAYFQYPSQRAKFQQQLDTVAQRIYFSPQTQIQPPYEIQPGDQLRKIANKYQLSWQYLSTLNQVDARKIRPGKLLKVFQGPFEAKVDLSDFELTVLLNGQYVKRYVVGIGKMNTSPIGEFAVREKLENPTYFGPNGMVLEADDPQNPLGERWIDIGNSFGIHGTIEPESIGKSESAGCIRMRNEDVAEVYDLLTVGSQVRIQR